MAYHSYTQLTDTIGHELYIMLPECHAGEHGKYLWYIFPTIDISEIDVISQKEQTLLPNNEKHSFDQNQLAQTTHFTKFLIVRQKSFLFQDITFIPEMSNVVSQINYFVAVPFFHVYLTGQSPCGNPHMVWSSCFMQFINQAKPGFCQVKFSFIRIVC